MPAILKYFVNQLLRTPAAFSKTKNDVSPESQLVSDAVSPAKDIWDCKKCSIFFITK